MTRSIFKSFISAARAAVLGTAVLTLSATALSAGLDDPNLAGYQKSLAGKTVAFLPIAMSLDLAQGWYAVLKKELEPNGIKLTVRDPNWNTSAGAQALAVLIAERPDLIIAHSPDVQTYAKLLKQAQEAGIYVVQVQMQSSFRTDAYVGPNWVGIGELNAEAAVNACKGKSNKIAIMQGNLSAAASAYTLKGVENVLAKHPEIKVVSSQAANWDASKAKAITQTVLKQNPDLCAVVGFWEGMDIGTAAAIKEAGLTGKVFLTTSGGGEQRGACDLVKTGAFDLDFSYDVPTQGNNIAAMVKWLLQSGIKPGSAHGSLYTTLTPITKANASDPATCWKMPAAKS